MCMYVISRGGVVGGGLYAVGNGTPSGRDSKSEEPVRLGRTPGRAGYPRGIGMERCC